MPLLPLCSCRKPRWRRGRRARSLQARSTSRRPSYASCSPIVELSGVPETADALGITQATVKTHLHRLFRKTATARQVELVKLVAGFANPLVR